MISPDASLAFRGQTLEELWLLWWQPHVASRARKDKFRAGLAETPHGQNSRRLIMGFRRVYRHLEKHITLCYFGLHYGYYLMFRMMRTMMCKLLVGLICAH